MGYSLHFRGAKVLLKSLPLTDPDQISYSHCGKMTGRCDAQPIQPISYFPPSPEGEANVLATIPHSMAHYGVWMDLTLPRQNGYCPHTRHDHGGIPPLLCYGRIPFQCHFFLLHPDAISIRIPWGSIRKAEDPDFEHLFVVLPLSRYRCCPDLHDADHRSASYRHSSRDLFRE